MTTKEKVIIGAVGLVITGVMAYTIYDYNDFLAEYRGGNFDEDGNRIKPYGLFKNDNYNNLDLYPEK